MGTSGSIFEPILDNRHVCAGFSTRFGGVSKYNYKSLNLGDHVGDDIKNVVKNREILKENLGVENLKFMKQIHSNIVKILKDQNDEPGKCDAVITNLKNTGLCVMVADCAPILLYDKTNSVIAAIHAGRAGVIGKITTNTINLMQSEFGSRPSEIKAFIGAFIGSKCYDIGNLDLGWFNRFKNNNFFDIKAALKYELLELGVKDINFKNTCTHCDQNYFSYRRDKTTGRFCGVIFLRK